ncbi:MAG: DUF1800 domain-containing protein [Phycisphaeraceae bacterium]|nr:DUF1800 domain-containing protein [Phycisphaeraceae bacterium]
MREPDAVQPPADEPADEGRLSNSMRPIRREAFGEEEARHLLWRAGFGGNSEQIRTLAAWGPEKAVDHIVNYDQVPGESVAADAFDKDIMRPASAEERNAFRLAQRNQDEERLAELRRLREQREREDRRQMASIQRWWLTRMIETARPLEEKMTLLWHGHFATSYRTIENSYHMFAQNQLFRRNAAGNFGTLLYGIIRDPAMLAYLNNNNNRKDRPNENLARELMELFSLGIGNYTERDIKEGARALTGYTFEDDDFTFQRRQHDEGEKLILGRRGRMNGEDFVSTILAQPACARFVSRKLYHHFVADVPPDERGGDKELDPAQRSVLGQMATTLRNSNYELRPVLRRLLLSEHFYERRFRNQQIKSPVQLVVGALRSLDTPARDLSILNDALDLMGQRLFFPPSVKGWDGGRSWINTSTVFVRQNVMVFLLTGKKPQGFDATADTQRFDPMRVVGERRDPAAAVERVLLVTLGQTPSDGTETLRGFLRANGDRVNEQTVLGMLLLATAMPEYQLC